MHSKNLLIIVACLIGCILLASNTYATGNEGDNMEGLVKGNNAFALDLYARLSKDKGNLFFSPYSISTALAMTYAGARGKTEAQMAETLHFSLKQKALHPAFADLSAHFQEIQEAGNVALNIANAIWIQQDFELLTQFLDTVEEHYDAGLFQVNFAEAYEEARLKINAWVEDKTNKRIRDLLPPGVINALTRLVLTNAIYFKSNWDVKFEEDFTNEEPFWLTPEKKIMAPMMHQRNTFKYGEDATVQILQMPYTGGELSMVILLPKEKDGLAKLEADLDADQLPDRISRIFSREVDVSFPRFKLTSRFTLSTVLEKMGMTNAFSDGADFSGMAPGGQLSITEVLHKAFVEVNEEGTEAAAATAVVVGVTSVAEPRPVVVFKADHPFIFLIRDNQTGSILFLGKIMNPAE